MGISSLRTICKTAQVSYFKTIALEKCFVLESSTREITTTLPLFGSCALSHQADTSICANSRSAAAQIGGKQSRRKVLVSLSFSHLCGARPLKQTRFAAPYCLDGTLLARRRRPTRRGRPRARLLAWLADCWLAGTKASTHVRTAIISPSVRAYRRGNTARRRKQA